MPAEIKPAYMGEAMLLRWGDTHSSGRTITIQLDEHVGDQHPFKGLKCGPNGQRMQVCAVLVDDHDEPQNPHKTAPDSPPPVGPAEVAGEGQDTRRSFDSLPRSQQAGIMCGKPNFVDWLEQTAAGSTETDRSHYGTYEVGGGNKTWRGCTEDFADDLLKEYLGITSKKELDTLPHKAEAWDRMLASFKYREQVR